MPRSDAEQWRAIDAASPGPSPTALKMSSSMAAFSAAVRWCACTISKTMPWIERSFRWIPCLHDWMHD